MNRTIYKIHEIAVKDFSRKDHHLVFTVRFSKNDTLDEFDVPWNMGNVATLVNDILMKIKQRDKIIIEADSDDVLGNIYITRIYNEEEVEERMLDFFKRLVEKIKSIKHERRTNVFMNMLGDVKHQKLTL